MLGDWLWNAGLIEELRKYSYLILNGNQYHRLGKRSGLAELKYFNLSALGLYFIHFYNSPKSQSNALCVCGMKAEWGRERGKFSYILNVGNEVKPVQKYRAHIPKCFSFWVPMRLFLPSFFLLSSTADNIVSVACQASAMGDILQSSARTGTSQHSLHVTF